MTINRNGINIQPMAAGIRMWATEATTFTRLAADGESANGNLDR